MSIGTKYTVKQDLIDAVVALIFTNKKNEVSAADIQKSACDMIESLWDDILPDQVVNTTYTSLQTMISNSTLVPGTMYRFSYENIHSIVNLAIANTQIPGYTQRLESFLAFATDVNKIHGTVFSETNKYDLITYNPTSANVGSPSISTMGSISRRINVESNISTPFDFRNYWVARDNANWASYRQVGPVTASRAQFVEQAYAAPGSVFGCWFDGTVAMTQASVLTSQLWTATIWDTYFPITGTADATGTTMPMLGAINYQEAVPVTGNRNIFVDSGTFDIRIFNSSEVRVKGGSAGVTVGASKSIEIGTSCFNIMVNSCDDITVKELCGSIAFRASYNITLGRRSSNVWFSQVHDTDIRGLLTNSIIRDAMRVNIGTSNTSIMTDVLKDSTIESDTSFISIGFGRGLTIKSLCRNIVSLGGDFNSYDEDCNLINMDNRNGSGGSHTYLTYAPMDYTHFGKGCKNIIFQHTLFNPMSIHRCTFGENCENLTFNAAIEDTVFHRATKNKDFRGKALIRVAFLNSSDTPFVYSVGVPDQEFIQSGFTITATPQTVTSLTMPTVPSGGANSPIISQTYERAFHWRYNGQPVALLMY